MKKRILIIVVVLGSLLVGGVGGFNISKIAYQGTGAGYIDIGHQYLQEKNYMKSIAYFNRAVALDPNSFVAHISLADSYFFSEYFDLALEEYEIALQLSMEEKGTPSEDNYINTKIDEIKSKKSLKDRGIK